MCRVRINILYALLLRLTSVVTTDLKTIITISSAINVVQLSACAFHVLMQSIQKTLCGQDHQLAAQIEVELTHDTYASAYP